MAWCPLVPFVEDLGILFLGPPVVPFHPFWGEGPPFQIRLPKKKGALTLTSLVEDLGLFSPVGFKGNLSLLEVFFFFF